MDVTNKHAGNLTLLGGQPCLDFVNTLDWRGTDHPVEFLHTYPDLIAWSRHAGTISKGEAARLSQKAPMFSAECAAVLEDALQIREALYRIFSTIAQGHPAPDEDLAVFNRYLSAAMMDSQLIQKTRGFVWDTNRDPEKLDWILNPIIRSAADVLVSEKLPRVKKCGDPACGWLFLDISRNHSRRWCDMRDCGNRAKANRFYQKKKKSSARSTSPRATTSIGMPKSNLDRHLL
jgi:predicted RNA-binding Zn ribbon-like protein